MKTIKYLLLVVVVLICAGVVYLYSGAYNIGTDVPHTAPMHWLLSTLRDRSIETHAQGIKVPPLNDQKMIATGARRYEHLCSGCHLAPGMPDTEIRQGLYPKPPDLSKHKPLPPAMVFWIIKHGIKFTAMPAWGPTHDDPALWPIVAFVEKQPSLSSDQYAAMTRRHSHAVPSTAAPASAASSALAPASSVMSSPTGNSSVAAPATPTSAPAPAAPSSRNSPPS